MDFLHRINRPPELNLTGSSNHTRDVVCASNYLKTEMYQSSYQLNLAFDVFDHPVDVKVEHFADRTF